MKRAAIFLVLALLVFPASALASVIINVDAAPNVYGSPAYDPWLADVYDSIFDGSFQNMSNGYNAGNVGTTNFEIQDEVVYSFGDLGKRLTWIYWMEGETVASLEGRLQISLFNTWDGDVMDFYGDYYGATWQTPTKIFDYDGDGDGQIDGVFGLAGMAWWGAKDINTSEALNADISAWGTADEEWLFQVMLDNEITDLTSYRAGIPAPEPSTFFLLGAGLLGLVAFGRKKFAA